MNEFRHTREEKRQEQLGGYLSAASPAVMLSLTWLRVGLRTHEWRNILRIRAFPRLWHSGVMQNLGLVYRCGGSAGFVFPDNDRKNAPASRFIPRAKALGIPEAVVRVTL
uniref:Uncharacterized protein n=1 Tax=Candidatus Kentrum sp. FW TaxID=2126338 RepID=A0A450TR80_9GAMM|nr:MAG: hypothetical protein BECKFW1821C_GA0114237_102439 [Candidatus Kentron sp. FW]